jgi:hypothetical protein
MGKPIAKAGNSPFTTGGYCVTAAKINGVTYTNLNIYQQRSDMVFDLIDTSGNIYTFISLVYNNSESQTLNPSLSTEVLVNSISDNCFFIKATNSLTTNTSFVISFQSNKLKLANGEMLYRPFDLFYCNIPTPEPFILPDMSRSYFSGGDVVVPATGEDFGTADLFLVGTDGKNITNYDVSKIKMSLVNDDGTSSLSEVISNGNGVYYAKVYSTVIQPVYFVCSVNGETPNMTRNFVQFISPQRATVRTNSAVNYGTASTVVVNTEFIINDPANQSVWDNSATWTSPTPGVTILGNTYGSTCYLIANTTDDVVLHYQSNWQKSLNATGTVKVEPNFILTSPDGTVDTFKIIPDSTFDVKFSYNPVDLSTSEPGNIVILTTALNGVIDSVEYLGSMTYRFKSKSADEFDSFSNSGIGDLTLSNFTSRAKIKFNISDKSGNFEDN